MEKVMETLQAILVWTVPIVSVVGLLISFWSAARTRRSFYDDYLKNRGRTHD